MVKALIEEYGSGLERVREAIRALSEEEMHYKPGPSKWSIHEIIVHLADAELVGVHRMKRVLAENNPMLTVYDQDAWATSLGYADQDAEHSLKLFGLMRAMMLPVLLKVEGDDWQRCGIHEEAGPLTLVQLLERYVNHVSDHLEQIQRVRAAYREQTVR
ncbi:DinB family protein [Brevibacillus choshinensis]|uniref:DinB family protein n=1 Tax=Brevibacillus choshinensis TaxID=54911 RepID=UPI002E245CF7|nr:DinB family protein [Brevibacillus choshinensis]MED4781311.1 DinB family protein [Brevibacillus choshinensis]